MSPIASPADWAPAELVHPNTPFSEYFPDIAVGPSGIPIITWHSQGNVWWTQWNPEEQRWAAADLLGPVNSYQDEFSRVAVGSDGVPWVVWSQSVAGTASLLSSRYVGGAWTMPDTVLTPAERSGHEILALSESDAWVVMHGRTEATGSQAVVLVRHYEGGKWVEYGPLYAKLDPNAYDWLPDAALDASGTLWVAWHHHTSSAITPYVSRLGTGGKWTTPEPMTSGYTPHLAALSSGEVMVVWISHEDPIDSDVAYRIWANGKWGPVGQVNKIDGPEDIDIRPAVGSNGQRVVVTWVAGPYPYPDLRDIMASAWTGSSWTPEVTVSLPDSTGFGIDEDPRAALGLDGTAWTCWTRLGPWPGNPDSDVWFSRGQLFQTTSSPPDDHTVPASTGDFAIRSSPNPSSGVTTIEFSVPHAGDYEATIVDVLGRIVDRIPFGHLVGGQASAHSFRWPAGKHPGAGMYTLRLKEVTTQRIVSSGKFVLFR